MTSEPKHTTEERIVLGLSLSAKRTPRLSNTEIKKWPLGSIISYVQPITQHYKQTTLGEGSMQSIQSQWKTQMFWLQM